MAAILADSAPPIHNAPMRRAVLTLVFALAASPCAAICHADDAAPPGQGAPEPLLQPYEPITAGYTKDSNDVPFMDVTLSLKYRLLPVECTGEYNRLFVSLTTRFGFYWGTRENSPVIGKSYNPKLIWRYLPHGGPGAGAQPLLAPASPQNLELEYKEFFDFAYAHESNGQLIHTPQEYAATQAALQQPQYVNDEIHRGWDYLEVAWKKTPLIAHERALTSYLDLKYFLPKGLLQGPEDQYHDWENNPQGKPRDEVDGIAETVRYQWYGVGTPIDDSRFFSRPDLTLRMFTGYHDPLRYDTVRLEFGFETYTVPIAFWVQSGYMSDLAMYYEKVNSYGIEVRIRGF
jgi:hypothetical protein